MSADIAPRSITSSREFSLRWGKRVVAVLVMVSSLGLAVMAWNSSRHAVQDTAAQRFEFEMDELGTAIADRMINYEQMLWAGVGLFNASDEVSRSEWNKYVESLRIEERWPGIQGIGFALPIDPDGLDAHVREIQAEGFPDYTVRPEGARSEYTSIIYLEPFDERNRQAFGFDMWSNDVRREAMTRARDGGVAASSGAITLVQEIDDDVQRGFLTYVPVYSGGSIPDSVEERRAQFVGWVYAPFRAGDLMNGIVGSELDRGVSFEVFDGQGIDESNLLFDSNESFQGIDAGDTAFQEAFGLTVQGREWTVAVQSGPNFISASEARQPALIAVAGIAANLVLFSVIASLWLVNRRAETLAAAMTLDLHDAKLDLQAKTSQLELYAGRLEGTNTRLEDTNAELEQFIFTAAHDLQAPLRTISSYASFINDGTAELSDDQHDCVERISESSNRMSQLLVDLLTYARLSWDRQPSEIDLAELAATVANDVVPRHSGEVTFGPLPVVSGHEAHLRLLLQNLLDNAVKFAKPDEALRIRIEAHREGPAVVVSVEDNGVGFDPNYGDKVFSVFQRLPDTQHIPGTGIGLAHCRKIARMHHGTAWADSAPGSGSTFYFSIATDPTLN